MLDDLIEALRGVGLNIPDCSNTRELIVAVKANTPIKKGAGTGGDDDYDVGDTTAAPGGPPMLMSTLEDPAPKKQRMTAAQKEAADWLCAKLPKSTTRPH